MNDSTLYAVSAQTLPVLALAAILELRWFLDEVLITTKARRFVRITYDLIAVGQGLGIILALLILPKTILAAASPSEAPGWLRTAILMTLQLVVITLLTNPLVVVMGRLKYPPDPVPFAELREQSDELKALVLRLQQLSAERSEIERQAPDGNRWGTSRVLAVVGMAAAFAYLRRRRTKITP